MTPATPFAPFAPVSLDRTSTAPHVLPLGRPSSAAEAFTPVEVTPPAPPTRTMVLAKKAGKGDTVAMRELLRELGPRIQRVVSSVLGRGHGDSEDVTQQALLAFVQALPSFRGECEPVHFASRVAARTAIAAARRGRALRSRHEDGVELDHLTSGGPAPLADAERTRRTELLRDALARIPAEQAETLALRIVLGWSLSEVAERMGVPLNTVRSRLRLAKTALRTVISGDAVASEELGE